LGQKDFYDFWEEANFRTAGNVVGVDVVKYGADEDMELSRKNVMRLINRLAGRQTEEEFTDILGTYGQLVEGGLLTAGRMYNYGLRKNAVIDVITGKASAQEAAKVARIMAQYAASVQQGEIQPAYARDEKGGQRLVGFGLSGGTTS
jgi:hypothetical protein